MAARTGEPLRVYLAGNVCIEHGAVLVPESRFPGRQGKVAFAMLAAEHDRAVSLDELANELWDGEPPRSWETALRAIASKLRGVLQEAGLGGGSVLTGAVGAYQLRLPAGAWLDLEAAADAAHRAESALRAGDPDEANGWSLVAAAITARPFLPGEDGEWVGRKRSELRDIRVRALESRAAVCVAKGHPAMAVRDAEEVLALEPFRETAYRLLMQAHREAGNLAEAIRAYERCRRLLAQELGTGPSPGTEELYLEMLRSS